MVKSFKVDHTKLSQGLYVQECKEGLIVMDLRFLSPLGYIRNKGLKFRTIEPAVLHAIEHLLAYNIRKYNDNIISVYPYGCQTGLGLILKGDGATFLTDFYDALKGILSADSVPGNTLTSCGNPDNLHRYTLKRAKEYISDYKTLLQEKGVFEEGVRLTDLSYPLDWLEC